MNKLYEEDYDDDDEFLDSGDEYSDWYCVCGAMNYEDDPNCVNCGRSKEEGNQESS